MGVNRLFCKCLLRLQQSKTASVANIVLKTRQFSTQLGKGIHVYPNYNEQSKHVPYNQTHKQIGEFYPGIPFEFNDHREICDRRTPHTNSDAIYCANTSVKRIWLLSREF